MYISTFIYYLFVTLDFNATLPGELGLLNTAVHSSEWEQFLEQIFSYIHSESSHYKDHGPVGK